MMPRISVFILTLTGLVFLAVHSAQAYPEFQEFSKKNSKRYVNCAMCHANPDGPDGIKSGQIGSLNPEQMQRLNKARGAFEPGMEVDSPILNAFGNEIMKKIGKKKLLELRKHPDALPAALGFKDDLDHDGIPDAQEYLDGTYPLSSEHGDPMKLFAHRLWENKFDIFIIILATFCGLYGLNHLIHWLHNLTHEKKNGEKED